MARIIPLSDSGGDPATVVGQAIVYSKDDGGVVKGYVLWDDGTVTLLGGGSGSADASATYVFRSASAFTGPTVFNDFNALYAVLDAARSANNGAGRYVVLIDDTDESPVQLNSGPGNTTYDFVGVELVGIHQNANVALEVADDGGEGDSLHIDNALWFTGLDITTGTATDTPFFADDNQTITLNRTKFTGAGEYVFDVLTKTGVKFQLNDGSQLIKGSNAAIRANNSAVVVNFVGNDTVGNTRFMVSGVGGSLTINVYSPSARVDQDQLDITVTAFNMLTSSGYFNADPNTKVTAQKGVQLYDTNTGYVWRNYNGTTGWAKDPFGAAGYVTLDTATEKTIFTVELPTVAEGAAYAVDFHYTLPIPAGGASASQGASFEVESGDASITYVSFSESGSGYPERRYSGRAIISFGPVAGPNQNVMRSWMQEMHDPSPSDVYEVRPGYNGPELFATPIDQTLRVFITLDVAADTGEETQAHATISRLA